MADVAASKFARFVDEERRANRLPPRSGTLAEGEISHALIVDDGNATELLRVAARRAAGLVRPSKRTEVVWVDGDRELAINLGELHVKTRDGLIRVLIPVRCDETGSGLVEVVFAVGSPDEPAGLYASTYRRPNGPPLIVGAWGEALVAFAWQCVLGMVTGVAGAVGKDGRGNVLVPAEMIASSRGIQIVPMARHRFAGSSGLRAGTKKRTPR